MKKLLDEWTAEGIKHLEHDVTSDKVKDMRL